MKSLTVLFGALITFSAGETPARSAPVDSTLSAVTVYTDRAVVTRTASVNLPAAGPVEVVFARLPDSLFDQSLQIAGTGTAQATILDVSAKSAYVDLAPEGRVGELEAQIHDLQQQRQGNDDQLKLLADQEEVLRKIENAATTPPTKETPAFSFDDAAKLMSFLSDQRGKLSTEKRRLADQNEAIDGKRQSAEHELAEWRGGRGGRAGRGVRGRDFKSVTVRLSAGSVGTLDLKLSYTVPDAHWRPSYDARVLGAEKAVQLGYFGIVQQNTGEDWKDVDLTLSTAQPSLGGSPPPLSPWTVDLFRPETPEGDKDERIRLAPFAVSAAQKAPYQTFTSGGTVNLDAVALAMPKISADFAEARAESAATSATFKIAVKATILCDNAPAKVPVTSLRLASAPEYLAVPKTLAAAFLTDKVTNSSDFPFLAGEMNVFLDETFVATSRLRTVMPGEKFDLALGADEGIALKRKLDRRFTEDTGLLTKAKRVTYEFTLTAQNNKPAAATLVLLDQIPVSRNEKVVVKVLAPGATELKPDSDGTVKWTLTLAPGQKRELPLKFTIDYPSDISVVGLE